MSNFNPQDYEWNTSFGVTNGTMSMRPKEIRTVSPTGGEKGQKPCQMSTLEPFALEEVGKVGGVGAQKYSRHNYLKGYDWSLSYDALQRHMLEWAKGVDFDPETGCLHAAHAAWHALALVSFYYHSLGTDNRWSKYGKT